MSIRNQTPRVLARTPKTKLVFSLFRLAGALTRRAGYRGVGRLALLLNRIIGSAPVAVRLAGGEIEIDLCDYYWVRLIFEDYVYEPEIEQFLTLLDLPDFYWIDCGANIGYWCVRLCKLLAPERIVGIEAAPATFAKLAANSRLSRPPFGVVNRAIADVAGQHVPFQMSSRHASAHLADVRGHADRKHATIDVETTTIDEIVSALPDTRLPIAIKLDIEGAEIAALHGATATFEGRDVAIVYECHGSDRECRVTRHLLSDSRFDVYSLEGGLTKIASASDALALKTDRTKGYNFAAIKKSLRVKRSGLSEPARQ
jgi:FkbM family methyltransferase